MKEANRTQITETICKQAQLMRKGGANQTEIGKLLGVNPCTISRIEKAGFDLATYQESRRMEKQKEKAAKMAADDVKVATVTSKGELVPGQLEMDLPPKKTEMSDQTKLMRFQAHQADRIVKAIEENAVMLNTKLDKLNDTLCMILRAIRKE